jgi:hypothetical protein
VQGIESGIGRTAETMKTERGGMVLFVLVHVCCICFVLSRLHGSVNIVRRDTQ